MAMEATRSADMSSISVGTPALPIDHVLRNHGRIWNTVSAVAFLAAESGPTPTSVCGMGGGSRRETSPVHPAPPAPPAFPLRFPFHPEVP